MLTKWRLDRTNMGRTWSEVVERAKRKGRRGHAVPMVAWSVLRRIECTVITPGEPSSDASQDSLLEGSVLVCSYAHISAVGSHKICGWIFWKYFQQNVGLITLVPIVTVASVTALCGYKLPNSIPSVPTVIKHLHLSYKTPAKAPNIYVLEKYGVSDLSSCQS